MLQFESRVYRLKGTTPILGSQPASQAIRTEFIVSKAPTEELREEEMRVNNYDKDEKGLTVFARNSEDHDKLCLMAHQIKGFLKEALGALKPQLGIAAHKGKIDTLVSIGPRFINLTRGGKPIMEEDMVLERPLRAETMQGPRIALQGSEQINVPWEIEFEVVLFPSSETKRSNMLTWDAIETAFDYGAYHGLGQWRGADYGHFVWERVDSDD